MEQSTTANSDEPKPKKSSVPFITEDDYEEEPVLEYTYTSTNLLQQKVIARSKDSGNSSSPASQSKTSESTVSNATQPSPTSKEQTPPTALKRKASSDQSIPKKRGLREAFRSKKTSDVIVISDSEDENDSLTKIKKEKYESSQSVQNNDQHSISPKIKISNSPKATTPAPVSNTVLPTSSSGYAQSNSNSVPGSEVYRNPAPLSVDTQSQMPQGYTSASPQSTIPSQPRLSQPISSPMSFQNNANLPSNHEMYKPPVSFSVPNQTDVQISQRYIHTSTTNSISQENAYYDSQGFDYLLKPMRKSNMFYISQTKGVMEYTQIFHSILKATPREEINIAEIILNYIYGLSGPVSLGVLAKQPESLPEAYETALKLDGNSYESIKGFFNELGITTSGNTTTPYNDSSFYKHATGMSASPVAITTGEPRQFIGNNRPSTNRSYSESIASPVAPQTPRTSISQVSVQAINNDDNLCRSGGVQTNNSQPYVKAVNNNDDMHENGWNQVADENSQVKVITTDDELYKSGGTLSNTFPEEFDEDSAIYLQNVDLEVVRARLRASGASYSVDRDEHNPPIAYRGVTWYPYIRIPLNNANNNTTEVSRPKSSYESTTPMREQQTKTITPRLEKTASVEVPSSNKSDTQKSSKSKTFSSERPKSAPTSQNQVKDKSTGNTPESNSHQKRDGSVPWVSPSSRPNPERLKPNPPVARSDKYQESNGGNSDSSLRSRINVQDKPSPFLTDPSDSSSSPNSSGNNRSINQKEEASGGNKKVLSLGSHTIQPNDIDPRYDTTYRSTSPPPNHSFDKRYHDDEYSDEHNQDDYHRKGSSSSHSSGRKEYHSRHPNSRHTSSSSSYKDHYDDERETSTTKSPLDHKKYSKKSDPNYISPAYKGRNPLPAYKLYKNNKHPPPPPPFPKQVPIGPSSRRSISPVSRSPEYHSPNSPRGYSQSQSPPPPPSHPSSYSRRNSFENGRRPSSSYKRGGSPPYINHHLSEAEKKRRIRKGLCLLCGGNHLKRFCPDNFSSNR